MTARLVLSYSSSRKTLFSSSQAGAQAAMKMRSSVPLFQILCGRGGGMSIVSPGTRGDSSSPSFTQPVPESI